METVQKSKAKSRIVGVAMYSDDPVDGSGNSSVYLHEY